MASKGQVMQFFLDNANRINAIKDPIAHNTNAGLLALTNFLAAELHTVQSRLDDLERRIKRVSP